MAIYFIFTWKHNTEELSSLLTVKVDWHGDSLLSQIRLDKAKQGTYTFCFIHLWPDRPRSLIGCFQGNMNDNFFHNNNNSQNQPSKKQLLTTVWRIQTNCYVKTNIFLIMMLGYIIWTQIQNKKYFPSHWKRKKILRMISINDNWWYWALAMIFVHQGLDRQSCIPYFVFPSIQS